LETIVGLQTDKPLKRAFMPFGGIRMAEDALNLTAYNTDPENTRSSLNIVKPITKVSLMFIPLLCESTSLQDRHWLARCLCRGRIVSDFPRIAIYGIDRLMADKFNDLKTLAMAK
jgi:formate C-acetyltransferase